MVSETYKETLRRERDLLVKRATSNPTPANSWDLIEVANVLTGEINRLNGFPR